MAAEVDELTTSLKTLSTQENANSTELCALLEKIIKSAETDVSLYESVDVTNELIEILSKATIYELKEQMARTIAEIGKVDGQRKRLTNLTIIQQLLKMLEDLLKIKDNRDKPVFEAQLKVAIQSCRALGNICYNNDDARHLIRKVNGDLILINLLDIKLNADNEIDLNFGKLRGALLSNYLVGGEELAKHAMELNIMDKIQTIIENCCSNVEKNEEILLNTLPPLSILTENVADLNFSPKLNSQLANILATSKHPDIADICLEMLHYQAENDDVKLQLAKEGVCETIYRLLETYKTLASTSEAKALMKLACDLIVLILTGDDSMHYLYKTPLLKCMEDWLDSYDVDLLTTGVLALGNFARTDTHCIEMVERNIPTKLLEILAQNNGVDNEMRLQHALLSTLRNLVIPKHNKPLMIKAGLVQTILPMLEIHQAPVLFKLLGTLRMTIDGQVQLAHELLENAVLIRQLVHWSKSSDCSSVTGESYRLMAWLIKHAYKNSNQISPTDNTKDIPKEKTTKTTTTPTSATVVVTAPPTNQTAVPLINNTNLTSLKKFMQVDGAVLSMLTMLTSQHFVMQNEALIALCIIASIFNNKENSDVNLDKLLIECDLGGKLAEFISRNTDSMTKEIVENVQTLMILLRTSNALVQHLTEHNIDELLKSIPILTEYCTL